MIEQAVWVDPQVRVFSTKTIELPEDELEARRIALENEMAEKSNIPGLQPRGKKGAPAPIVVDERYRLIMERPDESLVPNVEPEQPSVHTLGMNLNVEVLWPTVAKSSLSKVSVFAQTKAGRDMAAGGGASAAAGGDEGGSTRAALMKVASTRAASTKAVSTKAALTKAVSKIVDFDSDSTIAEGAASELFDVTIPGTIELKVGPSGSSGGAMTNLPPGYADMIQVGAASLAGDPIDVGAFTAAIKIELGDNPTESLVGRSDLTADQRKLLVTADDEIFIGFRYEDQDGKVNWFTQRVTLGGASMFNIYDRNYETFVDEYYVGETAYLRVVDPLANVSGEKDRVTIQAVLAIAGEVTEIELVETLSHSGIFQSSAPFSHENACLSWC